MGKHTSVVDGLDGTGLRHTTDAGEWSSVNESRTSHTSFTLASTLDTVDRMEQEAEAFAARQGFPEDEAANIAMAVREATVNAVLHGNSYSREKQVSVVFESDEKSVFLRVADEGAGFNAALLPDPLSTENILRGSGRGVFLMRALMDEVHFRQLTPGTELVLIKHRPAATIDAYLKGTIRRCT